MITGTSVEKGQASVQGLRLAFESAGSGDPAVMLIHGFFADRSYYASLQTHLAGRRRVVALDLRGHGESDSAAEVTVDDFADDVIAVADAAGVRNAVLCGHSMGGVVALLVAARRPDLVRGIVMLDGTVLFPEPMRRLGLDTLVPALGTDHWLEALTGFFGRALAPEPAGVRARVVADMRSAGPEFARSFFSRFFVSDFRDALTAVRCPLLYVRGTAPTDMQLLAELRPDAMVGQVVGAGHWVMLSAPEQVNAMIDRFLEDVEAP